LIFRVKIHAVRDASEREIETGMPDDGPNQVLH